MLLLSLERAFRRFQSSGDPSALARVFDAAAPKLRGLAAHLASCEAPADDLLQATFLTAIESRQAYDAEQPLLPWLAGILANHARDDRRRHARAIDRERLQRAVGVDPFDDAASAEISARLDQAIAALPEPYRAVLRLHLENGLEPSEIARSLERPPGTVRAQLSRGLERLRRSLPTSFAAARGFALVSDPQLAAIRDTVLRQCAGNSVAVASGTLFLRGLMSSTQKLTLAAAVLAVILIFVVHNKLELDATPPTPVESVSQVPKATTIAKSTPSESSSENRSEAHAPPQSATTSESSEPSTTGSLRVHLADRDGSPVANAAVGVRSSLRMQGPDALHDFIRTDASGTATFDGLAPAKYSVDVDRGNANGEVEVLAGEQTEHSIRLRGVLVEGRVLDHAGAPVAAAGIWAVSQRLEDLQVGASDAAGAFRIECVVPGMELRARKEGFAPSKGCQIPGRREEGWRMQLTLEEFSTEVSGRIGDPSGSGVAGAVIAFVPEVAKQLSPRDRDGPQIRPLLLRANADGEFTSREIPRGAVIVTASGLDQLMAPVSKLVEIGPGPVRLELRLGSGATIEGRITEGGIPAQGWRVVNFTAPTDLPASYVFNELAMRGTFTDEAGHFRLTGVLPGKAEMRAFDDLWKVVRQQRVPLAEGESLLWDIELPARTGRPFDIAIEPPSAPTSRSDRWMVTLRGTGPTNPTNSAEVAELDGRVHIGRLPDGRYTAIVYCQPEGKDLIPMLTREFDAREERITLQIPPERLLLQPVHGRLVDASSVALGARTLRARALADGEPLELKRTTSADGSFSFAGLPPGRYAISLVDGDAIRVLREISLVGDRAEELGDIALP